MHSVLCIRSIRYTVWNTELSSFRITGTFSVGTHKALHWNRTWYSNRSLQFMEKNDMYIKNDDNHLRANVCFNELWWRNDPDNDVVWPNVGQSRYCRPDLGQRWPNLNYCLGNITFVIELFSATIMAMMNVIKIISLCWRWCWSWGWWWW